MKEGCGIWQETRPLIFISCFYFFDIIIHVKHALFVFWSLHLILIKLFMLLLYFYTFIFPTWYCFCFIFSNISTAVTVSPLLGGLYRPRAESCQGVAVALQFRGGERLVNVFNGVSTYHCGVPGRKETQC